MLSCPTSRPWRSCHCCKLASLQASEGEKSKAVYPIKAFSKEQNKVTVLHNHTVKSINHYPSHSKSSCFMRQLERQAESSAWHQAAAVDPSRAWSVDKSVRRSKGLSHCPIDVVYPEQKAGQEMAHVGREGCGHQQVASSKLLHPLKPSGLARAWSATRGASAAWRTWETGSGRRERRSPLARSAGETET